MIDFVFRDGDGNKYNVHSEYCTDIINFYKLLSNNNLSDEFRNNIPFGIIYQILQNNTDVIEKLQKYKYIVKLDDFVCVVNNLFDHIYYNYFKKIIELEESQLFCINSDDLYSLEIIFPDYDNKLFYHSSSEIIKNYLDDHNYIPGLDYILVKKQIPILNDGDIIVDIIEIDYYLLTVRTLLKSLKDSNNYYYRYYLNIKEIMDLYKLYLETNNKKRKNNFDDEEIFKYIRF